jgi:hypothetical protein
MLEIILPSVAIIGLIVEVGFRLKDSSSFKRQLDLQSEQIDALKDAVKEFKKTGRATRKAIKDAPKVQETKLEQEREKTRRKEMEEQEKTKREGMRTLKGLLGK